MDAPDALREFLMYVVANLIDHPEQASIAVGTTSTGAISFRIQLAPDDVRRVIGKNGFTISSIRSLLSVAAQKHGVRFTLRVDGVPPDEEATHAPTDVDDTSTSSEPAAKDAQEPTASA